MVDSVVLYPGVRIVLLERAMRTQDGGEEEEEKTLNVRCYYYSRGVRTKERKKERKRRKNDQTRARLRIVAKKEKRNHIQHIIIDNEQILVVPTSSSPLFFLSWVSRLIHIFPINRNMYMHSRVPAHSFASSNNSIYISSRKIYTPLNKLMKEMCINIQRTSTFFLSGRNHKSIITYHDLKAAARYSLLFFHSGV